jgi:hypothetical protein
MSISSDNKIGLARSTAEHDGVQPMRFPRDAIAVSEIPKDSQPSAPSALQLSQASVMQAREDRRHPLPRLGPCEISPCR